MVMKHVKHYSRAVKIEKLTKKDGVGQNHCKNWKEERTNVWIQKGEQSVKTTSSILNILLSHAFLLFNRTIYQTNMYRFQAKCSFNRHTKILLLE